MMCIDRPNLRDSAYDGIPQYSRGAGESRLGGHLQLSADVVATFKLARSSVLATAGAPTPVPRSSVLVSDGNKKHLLIPSSVDDVEGKASNQPFAKSSCQWRARTGRGGNALRRLLDRR